MDTSIEIRRANLRRLINEVEQEIRTARGAKAELSRRTGVPAPMISQVLNMKEHQGGKARSIGDDTARKLERGMQKPKGWMDVAHNSALTESDSEILNSLHALTPDQRLLIEASINEYARLNRSNDGASSAPSTGQDLAH